MLDRDQQDATNESHAPAKSGSDILVLHEFRYFDQARGKWLRTRYKLTDEEARGRFGHTKYERIDATREARRSVPQDEHAQSCFSPFVTKL